MTHAPTGADDDHRLARLKLQGVIESAHSRDGYAWDYRGAVAGLFVLDNSLGAYRRGPRPRRARAQSQCRRPHSEPDGLQRVGHRRTPDRGRGQLGSRAWAQAMKWARSTSARCLRRRSQPRTVGTARPIERAMRQDPTPVEEATSAAPMTAAASTLRTRAMSASRTWVLTQPGHMPRRGRWR